MLIIPTALITGATAGLGAAFARRLATDGFDLVLVARDERRLKTAADEYRVASGVNIDILPADLATEAGVAVVERRLAEGVDLLVNNAGFGHRVTNFLEVPVRDDVLMMRLHCEAVLRLTRAALPTMVDRGRGGVINVASVAAFFTRGTYASSKAWVVSFSRAAAKAARPKGVHVLALCPGYTRTEFHQRAQMDVSGVRDFMWLTADHVVSVGMRDLRKGLVVSIPGAQYKVLAGLGTLLPANLAAAMSARADARRHS